MTTTPEHDYAEAARLLGVSEDWLRDQTPKSLPHRKYTDNPEGRGPGRVFFSDAHIAEIRAMFEVRPKGSRTREASDLRPSSRRRGYGSAPVFTPGPAPDTAELATAVRDLAEAVRAATPKPEPLTYSLEEAKQRIGAAVTVDWLRKHLDEIPHTRSGRGRGRAGRVAFTEAHLAEILQILEKRPAERPSPSDPGQFTSIVSRRR